MAARRRLPLIVAALAVTAGTATACTEANGTNGKDYVAGDGVVIEIPPDERGEPVELSGETLTGDQVDLADRRGSVVVVNVWWAGCPPCRKEAPLLVDASDELPGGGTDPRHQHPGLQQGQRAGLRARVRGDLPIDLRPRAASCS